MVFLDDVFRYAMARLGHREDAEDVAIEVVQSLPNPCYRRDLRVYMLGMARRKVADRLRKRRPTMPMRESEATLRFDDKSDEITQVSAAMEAIAPDHREVLTLKYIVGLSSAEIGKLLGIRSDAVDSRLQRGREAFARAYSSNDEVNL
jgi:RNA polymerase sigma-70 factor (ECF subfamily)